MRELRRGGGGRDVRARAGRGRAVEADPAEHLHAMGQRAAEGGEQAHRRPGMRPVRRSPAGQPHRGALAEAAAQAQPAAHLPLAEAGERLRRPQVPRGRGHQDCQYR